MKKNFINLIFIILFLVTFISCNNSAGLEAPSVGKIIKIYDHTEKLSFLSEIEDVYHQGKCYDYIFRNEDNITIKGNVICESVSEDINDIFCNIGSFNYIGTKIDAYECFIYKKNGNVSIGTFSINDKLILGGYRNYINYEYYTYISENGEKYKKVENYYYACTYLLQNALSLFFDSKLAQGSIVPGQIKIAEYSEYFVLSIIDYYTRDDVYKVYLNKNTKLIECVTVSKHESSARSNLTTFELKISDKFEQKYDKSLKLFEKYESFLKNINN